MNRRKFLGAAGLGFSQLVFPRLETLLSSAGIAAGGTTQPNSSKPYGSGNFGEWITDSFGLPAYRYTCDQRTEARALSPVHREWREPADHLHQVGNDRLVAVVSNYGYVQVRQDEGSPKFLNDYAPEHSRYGAGIGYFTDGKAVLSTYYPGNGESFERVFGEGYLKKTVTGHGYEVDQVIFAPFGDDPVLIAMVSITNHGTEPVRGRWVEYWNCLNYQFSYRAWMQATVFGDAKRAAVLRQRFGARFAHHFRKVAGERGLVESQAFLGHSPEDIQAWEKVEAFLKTNPNGFLGGPLPNYDPRASMEDLNPPRTFLISLDAPADGFATDAAAFFGSGGVERPSGLAAQLNNDLTSTGPDSAHLLERVFDLHPGKTHTIAFLYGYLPEGFDLDQLAAKYSGDAAEHWSRSSAAWKTAGLRLSVPSQPWVEREASWHHYYLRSNLTYDSFFREPILSQGHVYQYILGFQGAARDPLQHALPFIFSDPAVVRGILRYTLKEIQPDGSIPYGIVGSGVPMPAVFHPSDQELWLLWLVSEYVLSTRDKGFLDEKIPRYPRLQTAPDDPTVGELVLRSFHHFVDTIGVGEHGLVRLFNGDWNDEVVLSQVPPALSEEVRQKAESSLNASMACYVLDYYGRMLSYVGNSQEAERAHAKAEAQRSALRAQWTGRWFRRAWLGPHLGWLGEEQVWLEPQPWAIIGGAATAQQTGVLVDGLNKLVRQPSPIGAMLQSEGTPKMDMPLGFGENGGVWPSINGTLIWALATANAAMAWDEWKKNSLACHAEAYPDIWYGIWSGPDTYNSVLSRHPGETRHADPSSPDPKERSDWGVNWTDFPVMNMHPHAWPLYSAAKLLGLEFHETGVRFKPDLPLSEYEFTSPLLGFNKSLNGYTGWYSPSVAGRWNVELRLSGSETAKLKEIRINGSSQPLPTDAGAHLVRFSGESKPGSPLRWEVL